MLLVEGGRRAKLTDFGLSSLRPTSSAAAMLHSAEPPAAGAGAGAGTLLWMAPELHADEGCGGAPGKPSAAADVYALGITLWESLTGALPFGEHAGGAGGAVRVPFAVVSGQRPPLEAPPPGTPPAVAALLTAAWAPRPADRCTAQAAVDVLRAALGALGSDAAGATAGH